MNTNANGLYLFSGLEAGDGRTSLEKVTSRPRRFGNHLKE
jgi:hypothetical protein